MKIDIFNHVFPKTWFERYISSGAAGREIGKRMANATVGVDLEHRFRILDEFGDVRQVITLGQPPIEMLGGPAESPAVAREANDGLADLVEEAVSDLVHRSHSPAGELLEDLVLALDLRERAYRHAPPRRLRLLGFRARVV